MSRGEYVRHNIKPRIEQVHALDIRKIKLEKSGLCCIIHPDGHQINYRMNGGSLVIDTHNQVIQLAKTPCHYGGYRYWFHCPQCEKRVAVLYDKNDEYLCRHCHDLPYTSQTVKPPARLRMKARKLRTRLEASHDLMRPVTTKPKGMHWKTFNRLKRAELMANTQSLTAELKNLRQK